MIDRYGVTVLAATPSYLLFLASVMLEHGLDPAVLDGDARCHRR